MIRVLIALAAVSASGFAGAAIVPEIDANMGVSAITVLAGGAMVLRSAVRNRRRK